eukprot:TRINITY_DN38184_c0_g1_i1.p1 TRINITY_DN38184_c0_g1~~TRINITY_DN38184_c0_g1_i1.p1  ORF type:complete len:137 (+),score=13.49 TRINITY_DN38184_c0_g1_i1:63-473(+)
MESTTMSVKCGNSMETLESIRQLTKLLHEQLEREAADRRETATKLQTLEGLNIELNEENSLLRDDVAKLQNHCEEVIQSIKPPALSTSTKMRRSVSRDPENASPEQPVRKDNQLSRPSLSAKMEARSNIVPHPLWG